MTESKTSLQPLISNSNLDVDDKKRYGQYKNYLDEALNHTQVHNIAVTGKYGSGKSSIIDTYFKNRTDFLRVNFATFDANNSDINKEAKENSKDDVSGLIFSNIINQIIYQIDANKIPFTKFKVKHSISFKTKIMWSIEIPILIILLLNFGINFPSWLTFSLSGIFLILGCFLLWDLLSKIEIDRFKLRLKQVDTEIDMSQDNLFEKYTDEIIYLFENSGKNILVIEDLDRFRDLSIFEKLRELNTKLNHKTNSNWKFIYLINDMLFVNKNDRVKFFDEIIPVIPVITSINSFDKLRKLFDKEEISLRLLSILSVYIDDYRLLLNISNEFKVYKNVGGDTNLNELLALIAYKNLYPSKFDELQNGKGDLAEIVKEYKTKIKNRIKDVNEQLLQLQIKKDNTISSNEAEYLYLWSSLNNLLYYSDQNHNPRNSIDSIDTAKKIINENYIVGTSGEQGVIYSEWKQNNSFAEGLAIVTGYDYELSKLSGEIEDLKKYKLSGIKPSDFEIDNTLLALIKNDFVTLNYLNTINHYYGDASTLTFLKNLFSESDEFEIDMPLTDIKGLASQLDGDDFDKKQILNVHLAYWYFSKNDDKFERMIKKGVLEGLNFVEKLLNDYFGKDQTRNIYKKIIDKVPYIIFDLTALNQIPTETTDIINNNRYLVTKSNIDILVKWLKESDFSNDEYIELLNNEKIYEALKHNLIQNNPELFEIEKLNELNDIDLWSSVIRNDLIDATNSNVNLYVDKFDLDETIISFINKHDLIGDEEFSEDVFQESLNENELTPDKFREIWTQYDGDELSFEQIENVDKNKVQILIDNNQIAVTAKSLNFMSENNLSISKKRDISVIKNLIVENNIPIGQKMLSELLEIDDQLNDSIFADNLANLSNDEVVNYIKKNNLTSGKIIKVIYKKHGYQNIKFVDNEINIKLLDWLVDQKIIDNYTRDDGLGKLNLVVSSN